MTKINIILDLIEKLQSEMGNDPSSNDLKNLLGEASKEIIKEYSVTN
jgi:hypothetical protein